MSYISSQLTKKKDAVLVWERTPEGRVCVEYPVPLYFYIPSKSGEYTSVFDEKLTRCEFDNYGTFYNTRADFQSRKIPLFESDISPEYKVLSENYYGKSGMPNVTFYDIETDYNPEIGHALPANAYAPISAISMYHMYSGRSLVFAVPPKKDNWNPDDIPEIEKSENCIIKICKDEKELLTYFLAEIEDTDILSGWNSAGYDDAYVYERLKKVFGAFMGDRLSFPRAKAPFYKEYMNKFQVQTEKLIASGRVLLDYMELFVKFQQGNRDSYSLESISEEELPHLAKLEYEGSLYSLYNDNFIMFLKYNARDTGVLKGLEDKFGYMRVAVEMAQMGTSQSGDVLGTVKLTEMSVINFCHIDRDVKVPDTKERIETGEKFKGAFVVPTVAGMHEMVAAVDAAALYPSTIRTINISPETIMGQFYDNHMAFEHITAEADIELTILYENNMSETKTAKEWKEFLRESEWSLSAFGTVFRQDIYGIIPSILTKWASERKQFKGKMKELESELAKSEKGTPNYNSVSEMVKNYDRLQNIKKLSSNSFYGATGNPFFKFFDIRLAESTTRSGQEAIRHMLRTVGQEIMGEYVYPNAAILAGDTDSAMFKTFAETIDEGIAIGKYVEKTINNSFPNFVKDRFFVIDDNSRNLGVEFETLTRRGIYVKKKNYILNLAYKNGKIVDEMKITGLQIKKTNLPKYIRKDLTTFMTRYIKQNDWKSLGLEIVDYREQVKNQKDILQLGLPIGIKGFEDKFDEYVANGKQKTKMSGHASASVCWNEMLDHYGDKETPKIVSGMKIKRFILKKPIGFWKGIAVPTDLKIIPQWFKENIESNIDREQQVQRLIDKPLKNILVAVNENLPTRQSLLIEDEFI